MTMRSTPVWLGVLSLLGVFASCTSENAPIVYIGMTYQVRCLDCQPREPDPTPRDVRAVDGEAGFSLDCAVSTSGGTKRVSFGAEHQGESAENKYVLSVRNARIGGEESEGPCEVRVIEGNNTYVAGCSTEAPTTERPCQITLKEKAGVVSGKLYCNKMPSDVSLNQVRHLVAPFTEDEPVELDLYGCGGL
jgi:hypothetical protein